MQRKTAIALGAFIALAAAAWATMRAPEKGAKTGPRERPVPAFKASDVKTLETQNGAKDHVVMALDGTTWKIKSPHEWVADQATVKNVVDQLGRVSFGDLVTENVAKFPDLEVSDDKGAHVIAKDGAGKVLLDGWFGKSMSGFTMFRPAGKNQVWQSTGVFKYALARETSVWRDHTILDFNKDDVSKLAVEGKGETLVLEKQPAASKDAKAPAIDHWKVAGGDTKVDPLDETVPNNVVQAMATLRTTSFADDAKPADVGLAPPQVKITATVKGAPVTLLVGNVKGDDAYLQVEGRPQIYLVQKYTQDRVAILPMNYRDKTLVKTKADDITGVELTFAGETVKLERTASGWKSSKGTVDEGKVKALLGAFENIQGASFVLPADAKAGGLEKPKAVVTLRLKDKPPVTLRIGALKDDNYFVTRAGTADVMLAKKWTIERFLKKPSDIAK